MNLNALNLLWISLVLWLGSLKHPEKGARSEGISTETEQWTKQETLARDLPCKWPPWFLTLYLLSSDPPPPFRKLQSDDEGLGCWVFAFYLPTITLCVSHTLGLC